MNTAIAERIAELPSFRQIWSLLALAGAVALGLYLFFWSQTPAMAPLYPQLTERDAAEVTEALRGLGIEYQLDYNTGAVQVPTERLHEARLKLASQGLPQGSERQGFEVIGGDQGFGVSQFIEGARYQHALETELARSIKTLRPVKDVRVHLALPKPSAFARRQGAASASVVLELFPGRALDKNQVDAVVRMVAASVADLDPGAVAVVDQSGRLLTPPDPTSETALSDLQFERARRLEATYSQRIQSLIEPMTGPGRVSAEVAIDLDFSESEEARETFTPDPTKLRSEQTSEQSAGTGQPAGVPGALANTPPGPEPATGDAASLVSRSATRNFELDRTVSHTRQPGGRVRRVSAAVLVDLIPAADGSSRELTADELARLEALVREAIGFDGERGDSVSVMNAAFIRPAETGPSTPPPIWEHPLLWDALRLIGGSLAVIVLLLAVVKPMVRQFAATPVAVARRVQLDDLDSAAGSPRELPSASASGPEPARLSGYEQRLEVARSAVAQDPKRVAQVVKTWVGGDG
ncbi:MAG TPA: flagellar M-ring protein FliF [Xanthomonadales bacterium]|nr:flagellar M-ring protein FliF [Xanthomonadales bacterium]